MEPKFQPEFALRADVSRAHLRLTPIRHRQSWCQRASRKRRVKPEHFFLRATSMIYEALADFLQGLRLDLSPSNRKVIDKLDFRESVPYGSHIAVPSHSSQLGPWHHGILIDSLEVIHMYGDSKSPARVRSCPLKDFTAGTDLIAVVLYEGDSDAHRRDTRLAAEWMLRVFGNAAEPLYNIMGFNCEHFALLCRHGLSRFANVCPIVSHLFVSCVKQPDRLQKLCTLQDLCTRGAMERGLSPVAADRGESHSICQPPT